MTLLYKSVCVMCAHDNIEDRRVKHMKTTRTHKRRNTFGPSGLSLVKNNGGDRDPRAPPLDPPLEWSRNSCNNPISSACSLSLLLYSKPLTQLVSWHERKEKRESEHENRNKKTNKKAKPKTWWGLCSFFWLWKNLKAYNLNSGLFVSSIHLLSRFFCKAG